MALIDSCASFLSLQSNRYVQANIKVATDTTTVADMQLVKSWKSQYGSGYGAQDIGVMVGNQLAEQGWHDVWILVALLSREANENEKEDSALPSTATGFSAPHPPTSCQH